MVIVKAKAASTLQKVRKRFGRINRRRFTVRANKNATASDPCVRSFPTVWGIVTIVGTVEYESTLKNSNTQITVTRRRTALGRTGLSTAEIAGSERVLKDRR
jgi:hypothetical protein